MQQTNKKNKNKTGDTSSGEKLKANSASLELKDVCRGFGDEWNREEVIKDFSLSIKPAELTVLVGPSGCGKSALVNMLAGYDLPDTGQILLNKEPITGPGNDRMVVFQETALMPWLTAYQNVIFGPKVRKDIPSRELKEKAEYLFEKVGLLEFKDKYPLQLSGGMQQRVSIARALTFNPDLLLMDEPFGALDEIVRDQLNEHFHNLWEQTQKTVVFVTHSIPEAAYLSTKIVVMSPRPGKIIDIISNPLPDKRSLEMRDSQEFLELSQRIREGLRTGHSYD